jgi:hypothetical protein
MAEFPSKPLIQKGGVMLDPPPDRDVIHGQASLRHDLFPIPIAQLISQVPADAKHDDDIGQVSPTECRWLGSAHAITLPDDLGPICNTFPHLPRKLMDFKRSHPAGQRTVARKVHLSTVRVIPSSALLDGRE